MFAKQAGLRRFSLPRLSKTPSPTTPVKGTTDALNTDLTPKNHDDLFMLQLGLSKPKALHELSFYIARITDSEAVSKRTHTTLLRFGIVNAADARLDATKITRSFAHQFAFLKAPQQKKLVNLLFTWEEELMRWRLIEEEVDEIQAVIDAEREHSGAEARIGALEKRLKELEGLWKLRPSLRGVDAREGEQLPDYIA